MKPVLFVSARPLNRAENIKALYNAYPGDKEFTQAVGNNKNWQIRSGKYDLMVTDDFPYASPGKTIMIWHAIQGGKKIGVDQPRAYYHWTMAKLMDYIITPSTGTVDMFASCAKLPKERVLPLGMPRTDSYFGKHKGDGGTVLAQKRSYLFVPTFRCDHETKFPDIDWRWIDEQLTDDELFVIKFHPHRDIVRINGEYKHILKVPSSEPSEPYLIDCDVVITDYSSIMFDGYLLGKPSVLFEKEYGYTQTRGMYLKYPDQYSSRFCTNEQDLLRLVRSASDLTDVERDCLKLVADMCDGNSIPRVLELISRLNGGETDG